MKRLVTQGLVNRTGWVSGAWDNEPDKIQWEENGVPCLIVRNHQGAWCGYAGVHRGHALFQKRYQEIDDVTVHGDLTFSEHCIGTICHSVELGEDDNVWWLGFDCMHAFDFAPGLWEIMNVLDYEKRCGCQYLNGHYWTMEEVIGECKKLARQIGDLKK